MTGIFYRPKISKAELMTAGKRRKSGGKTPENRPRNVEEVLRSGLNALERVETRITSSLSFCLSVTLSVSQSVFLFVGLSGFSVGKSSFSVCPSGLCLFVCQSVCQSSFVENAFYLKLMKYLVRPSVPLFIHPSLLLSVCLSVRLSVFLAGLNTLV